MDGQTSTVGYITEDDEAIRREALAARAAKAAADQVAKEAAKAAAQLALDHDRDVALRVVVAKLFANYRSNYRQGAVPVYGHSAEAASTWGEYRASRAAVATVIATYLQDTSETGQSIHGHVARLVHETDSTFSSKVVGEFKDHFDSDGGGWFELLRIHFYLWRTSDDPEPQPNFK